MRGMFLAILLLTVPPGCFCLDVGFRRGDHLGLGGTGELGRQDGWYGNGDDGAQRSRRRRVAHRAGTKLSQTWH